MQPDREPLSGLYSVSQPPSVDEQERLHQCAALLPEARYHLVYFVVLNVKLSTLKSLRQTSTVYCLGVLIVLKFVT